MAAAFYAKATSSPPVGQLSVFSPETREIHFTVIIEWRRYGSPDVGWEVFLEHTEAGSEGNGASRWNGLPLKRTKSDVIAIDQTKDAEQDAYRAQFQATLPVRALRSISRGRAHECFTVKYRCSPHANWHYMSHESGLQDGEIIIQASIPESMSIHSYIQLGTQWKSKRLHSVGSSSVFSLESKEAVPGCGGKRKPQVEVLPLGKVINYTRWFSIGRYQEMWLGPRQGKRHLRLTEPTLTVSFLTETGQHCTFLALNAVENVQTHFVSPDSRTLAIAVRNDTTREKPCYILAAVSLDLESSISAAMIAAQAIVAGSEAGGTKSKSQSALSNTSRASSEHTPLDDWHDGLAFCTYNSLGLDLSTDRILGALESLSSNGIYPPTLIIDDNWQTITSNASKGNGHDDLGMERFEANETHFPEGLKAAISKIRSTCPHLVDIAVWHALLGYWGGIKPGSELTQNYEALEAEILHVGHTRDMVTVIDPQDVARWYDDFYAFLASCGVTGVKTDVQCQVDMFTDPKIRAACSTSYQSAWVTAHLRHFGGRAISCMSMIPQILFQQFQLPGIPRMMLRNSDDFYPEFPESHALHVFVNAHNTLLTKNLNALPDWDMFQTKQEYGWYHAAARALSGGPIYITDSPGEHDIEMIHQMTGISPSGRTVALRPDTIGRASWAYESLEEGKVLRIATSHGKNAMLGLFNTTMNNLTYLMPISDIPTASQHDSVLVTSHTGEHIYGPLKRATGGPAKQIYLALPVRGYEILTMFPVETVSEVSVAVLGLLGKMAGSAAVRHSTMRAVGDRINVSIVLKVLGVLGVWLKSERPLKIAARVGGESVTTSVESGKGQGEKVVKIDVLEAWRQMKFDKSGKSEAQVEIIIT